MEKPSLPHNNSQYKDPLYWDQRYRSEQHYEWLVRYSDLSNEGLLRTTLAKLGTGARILQLGCGNSDLARDLTEAGYKNITNIDISSVCVANMRTKYPDLTFLQMDMTDLQFPDHQFDLVLEKATLDSLLVDCSSPWDITSPSHKLVGRCLQEVKRVLDPSSGVFLSITFSQPHHRVPLLAQPGLDWEVDLDKLSGAGLLDYYVVQCSAGDQDSGPKAMARWGVGPGPVTQYTTDCVSEGEEDYINHLSIESSEDEEENRES